VTDVEAGAHVRVERLGVRVDVLLDRPAKLNALTRSSLEALADAFTSLPDDARVVVLRSTTSRAFCVGADLVEHRAAGPAEVYASSLLGHRAMRAIRDAGQPVIAQVAGHCLGGGLELALACDVRVAATSSRFAFPEVGLGHLPAWGGVDRLVALVGPGRALDLLVGGRTIDADEAFRLGLVEHVVADDDLEGRVAEIASAWSTPPAHAVAAAKRAVAGDQRSVAMDSLGAGFFQSIARGGAQ